MLIFQLFFVFISLLQSFSLLLLVECLDLGNLLSECLDVGISELLTLATLLAIFVVGILLRFVLLSQFGYLVL